MQPTHPEHHRIGRTGWLRAAVLGANDGIVSTASLVLGVASAGAAHSDIVMTGLAGLVAGAMSMAAGEYVSVHSQADAEQAELRREQAALHDNSAGEHQELAAIYVGRGLEPVLARRVARQLMAHDALDAHARDELGIIESRKARPLQAALVSALSFSVGAALPLLVATFVPGTNLTVLVAATSLLALVVLGAVAARIGGANAAVGALRIGFWGALAMAVTAAVGHLAGALLGHGG